ncbi:LysR family transcriptional regulator [Streptomyces stelliscabiei]|uniref:LysR family transcriptional regulator n=1 Tax=Streptomyces stelliscabiei TaxID=146820 RepID=UPI002FF22EA6
MGLRDIEIFLTLAEELHFGRTAERLHVSQARVSQAVRQQERLLGVTLFDRTSRRVTLTPVGRRLREDLQQALDLLHAGLARAQEAGRHADRTLRLGVFGHAGHELRPLVDAFRARHPQGTLQFGEINANDAFTALRAGTHDAHVLWLPVAEPDLTVGPTVLTGAACWPCPPTIRSRSAAPRPWRTSPTTTSSTSAPTPPRTGSPP